MTDLTTKLSEIQARAEQADNGIEGIIHCRPSQKDVLPLLRLVEVLIEHNSDLRRMVDLTTADYKRLERQQDQAALEAMLREET